RHFIEAFKVDVVVTKGAGDAFCAGFLYGLVRELGIKKSGIIGNFVAARCIMKFGARLGLPTTEELKRLNI
ncbi:MAG: PfkB family carbohydrate kinase, partial [Candidatus Bathyarchaeia archaeon]